MITGVTTGTDTVMYTNTNMCGTATVTKVISIDPPAVAGTISGASSLCVGGGTSHYTESTSGGTWSTSNACAHMGPAGNLTVYTAGVDTIIYTVNSGCHVATATHVVNIGGANAGIITGADTVCAGTSFTLFDAVLGGGWSASNWNAAVSGAGIVNAVLPGVDTIKYTVSGTCGTSTVVTTATASKIITINQPPDAGLITGSSGTCIGTIITLVDIDTGGIWSATSGIATVSSSGLVTGITPGIDTIKYTVSNSCGTAFAIQEINIDTTPNAGVITGPNHVCPGAAIICNESAAGGVWTTSNGNATVSYTGSVSGIAAGTDIITYTVTNSCGSVATEETITIDPLPDAGTITSEDSVCKGGTITLIDAAPGESPGVPATGNASVSGAGTCNRNIARNGYYTIFSQQFLRRN